jgi:hypothetical protein
MLIFVTPTGDFMTTVYRSAGERKRKKSLRIIVASLNIF